MFAWASNPHGILTAAVTLTKVRYPQPDQQADFFTRVSERIDALPGVQGCGLSSGGPMMGDLSMFYSVVGQPVPPIEQRPFADFASVGPGYFSTIGDADRAGADLPGAGPGGDAAGDGHQ